MSDEHDWDSENARHQRRMQLMREMGKTNRMETRMHIMWVVVAVLAAFALILGGMS